MDLSKLNALSTETLFDMNNHIVAVLRQRQTQAQFEAGSKLRIGQFVTFVGKGRHIRAIVDKINVKSVNVTEVDAHGARLRKTWRVSPNLLKQEAPPMAPAKPAAGSDRPITPGVAW